MDKKTKTTDVTYHFDDVTNKVIGKTIVETEDMVEPVTDNYEVETGVELDGIVEMSPLEIFLTAAVGALVGNLLYRAIRKD